MTYLLIITLAPSPIPSQIQHTLLDIISLGVDAVLCHVMTGTHVIGQFTIVKKVKDEQFCNTP